MTDGTSKAAAKAVLRYIQADERLARASAFLDCDRYAAQRKQAREDAENLGVSYDALVTVRAMWSAEKEEPGGSAKILEWLKPGRMPK